MKHKSLHQIDLMGVPGVFHFKEISSLPFCLWFKWAGCSGCMTQSHTQSISHHQAPVKQRLSPNTRPSSCVTHQILHSLTLSHSSHDRRDARLPWAGALRCRQSCSSDEPRPPPAARLCGGLYLALLQRLQQSSQAKRPQGRVLTASVCE